MNRRARRWLRDLRTPALYTAIEVVLLDHADELSGDDVDANMAELAYCYKQITGWSPDLVEQILHRERQEGRGLDDC